MTKQNLKNLIFNLYISIVNKLNLFKSFFSIGLYWIFFGFIFGNIFGTFLNFIRQYVFWDALLILGILIFFEFFNFFFYRKKIKNFEFFLFKNLNFFKIGIFFGFFVDAFKVGS